VTRAMQLCSACSASLRPDSRFCTQCGIRVDAVLAPPTAASPPTPASPPEPADLSESISLDIPARVPAHGRTNVPAARSAAATWTLVTGAAPLAVSIVGNLLAAQLGVAASDRVTEGDSQGAWASVLVVLALVFVTNAALLTVCTIMSGRALRETANGITRGRPLAIAGLAIGGVNLVLWVSGLIVSITGFNVVVA